ncbi:metallophosphoesterase family protein [Paucibacter soli]|uniref:metallophosphoesterase family protein n=1 Tax=Paucibacter soli TaxID=3133433 RepID=UPI0030B0224E
MKQPVGPLGLLLVSTLALLTTACGGGDALPTKQALAVIGDVPYGSGPSDTSQSALHLPFLKALSSDADISLVLHVGDIHSGKQYCTEAYDQAIANDWKTLGKPMVYTPGDNEWADCHKVKQGGGSYNAATGQIDHKRDANGQLLSWAGGDPIANLQLVRSIFFASPGSSQGAAMPLHSQAKEADAAFPSDTAYAENVWFEKEGVMFVAVNVPGGSNNDTDPWYGAPAMSSAQAQEVAARSAANKRWLDAAFKRATSDNSYAMVIQLQADMWDLDGNAPSHVAEYRQFIDLIAAGAKAFGKPVLLLNGDSHVFRSDNPLMPAAPCLTEPSPGAAASACSDDAYANQPHGYRVSNFHRLVVHGSTSPLEWLKLSIDPGYDTKAADTATRFGPFSWQRIQPSL